MNLEDHAGDVIRKGSMAAGLSAEVAAQKAGLSLEELKNYQESGQLSNRLISPPSARLPNWTAPNWSASPKAGCRPSPIYSMARVAANYDGSAGITVNCYLIWDEGSLDAALFDTGWEAAPILELLQQNGLELRAINS